MRGLSRGAAAIADEWISPWLLRRMTYVMKIMSYTQTDIQAHTDTHYELNTHRQTDIPQ